MHANPNRIIHLSINPWYFCNFRCEFCYLTEAQLSDRQMLSLEDLEERLLDIRASGHEIGHADIYGGEIMLLPKGYLQAMKTLLHSHGVDEIELITNLSAYNPEIVEDPDFGISVSYDFQHREKHEQVFANMLKISRPFTVLTLATPEVMTMNPDDMIQELSLLQNCKWVEIKPYSTNQANAVPTSFRAFENLVTGLLTSPIPHGFEFLNEAMIIDAGNGERNSFSDDHVYITPAGKFAVLEFDLNDNEFFMELESFEKYLEWCLVEKGRVYENVICSDCEFMGKCLSEHLRKVNSLDDSCNGFYHLIKWGIARGTIETMANNNR